MHKRLRFIANVQFSVEPAFRRRLKAAARRADLPLSEYLRRTLAANLATEDSEPEPRAATASA